MFRRLKDLIPIMGKENSLTWILFDVPDLGNFRVGNDDFPTHFPILVRQHFFLWCIVCRTMQTLHMIPYAYTSVCSNVRIGIHIGTRSNA